MGDAVRLLHISDLHVTARPRLGELAPKRVTGFAAGVVSRRRAGFRLAPDILAAVAADAAARRPDAVVFTGDATMLALPAEFAAAAGQLGVTAAAGPVGVAVPGNHDEYTPASRGRFEAAFAPWQHGERVDGQAYPFARRVGPVWLVALNSARPNRLPADASGLIGAAQLDRFRTLCAGLSPGPRLVVTHYPLTTGAGALEVQARRLVDHAEALAAARDCGVAAWLHGHIHAPFVAYPTPAVPVLRLCAGSSTQRGRMAVAEYTITGDELHGVRRRFDPAAGAWRVAETFTAKLAAG